MSSDAAALNLDRALRESKQAAAWQLKLLPFMMGALIFFAVFFLATTLWFFRDLEQHLEYKAPVMTEVLKSLGPTDSIGISEVRYRDWYVRAFLEGTALEQRFNVQATLVKGRLWTRFMGFLTGMLLALTGSVFVLGKLREAIAVGGEGQGFKATLATSSPGVFLAFLGSIVIAISLFVQASVQMTDESVYLPRQSQEQSLPGASEPVRPPPQLLPGATSKDGNAAKSPPDSVQKLLQEEAERARSASAPAGVRATGK